MTKVSIKTISEIAGVSKTTVSFVLNGRGNEKNISQATQKKIKTLATTLDYQPNLIARSLSLGRSQTIGFIVPDISNPFFAKIGKHIEAIAETKGYTVMFASSNEDEKKEQKLIESFKARQIDGIIIAPTKNLNKFYRATNDLNYPIVFFDRIYPNQKKGFININNLESTKNLTEILIKKGHKRIGLMSLTSYLPNISDRIKGYKEALKQYGISKNHSLIHEIDFYNKKADVQKALNSLISMKEPATAIIFLNNMLAAEGILAINKFHSDKIDNMDFASFDNLDMFDYTKPKVTSVIQPVNEIAEQCVNRICIQIENQVSEKGIHLKTKIIIR